MIADLALLLLPTSSHSLLARWQGPYLVLAKLSPTTYLVKVTGKRRPERVYHLNMLRLWNSPFNLCMLTLGDEDVPDLPTWSEPIHREEVSRLSKLLSQTEKEEVLAVAEPSPHSSATRLEGQTRRKCQ